MTPIAKLIFASAVAVALLSGAFWTWEAAADLASDWQSSRPDAALWAARSAAIAAAALAQAVLLQFVVEEIYPVRAGERALKVCFGCASILAGAVAVGCVVVAR